MRAEDDDEDDCTSPCTYDLKPVCAEWKNANNVEHEVFANPCFLRREIKCMEKGKFNVVKQRKKINISSFDFHRLSES